MSIVSFTRRGPVPLPSAGVRYKGQASQHLKFRATLPPQAGFPTCFQIRTPRPLDLRLAGRIAPVNFRCNALTLRVNSRENFRVARLLATRRRNGAGRAVGRGGSCKEFGEIGLQLNLGFSSHLLFTLVGSPKRPAKDQNPPSLLKGGRTQTSALLPGFECKAAPPDPATFFFPSTVLMSAQFCEVRGVPAAVAPVL